MAVDIPNYRVVEKLGVGAQTRIFRARCMRTGKDYAIKVVKIVNPEDAGFIDLLRTEHAIGSAIDHPVIRKVYELRMLRRRLRVYGAILFMEYVPGISLRDKDGKRTLDEIIRVFTEAARGLNAMHNLGYVHADLKPNNIMVSPDGAVKLIDLGQSSRMNEAKPRIQGTIHYMAPEQSHRGVLDQRTDVFGLGATLHHVLTGKPIKTEMNKTLTLDSQGQVGRLVEDSYDPAKGRLPICLNRLIEDCCQYDPEDRINDMPALSQRLDLARTILKKRDEDTASVAVEAQESVEEIEDDHFGLDEEDIQPPDL